jgi:hypothetical protein
LKVRDLSLECEELYRTLNENEITAYLRTESKNRQARQKKNIKSTIESIEIYESNIIID